MEMRARTYSYLEKTMNEQELDKFACDIATSYATSEGQYSRRYYTKIYNITSDCFYKLLERAIVRDLVLDEIVDKMRQKAYKNSNTKSMEKSGKNTVTSHIHYAKMIGERKWFKFLRDFPKNEKIEITTYFAEHFETSKSECAKKFNISNVSLDKIIENTLIENYVDDEIFSKIRTRSLGKEPTKIAINYFATLKRKRNKRKKTAS